MKLNTALRWKTNSVAYWTLKALVEAKARYIDSKM